MTEGPGEKLHVNSTVSADKVRSIISVKAAHGSGTVGTGSVNVKSTRCYPKNDAEKTIGVLEEESSDT